MKQTRRSVGTMSKPQGSRYCGISSGEGLLMDGAASGMKVA